MTKCSVLTNYNIPTPQQFLELMQEFCDRTGTNPSKLGRDMFNDPSFMMHIKRGREPGITRARKALEYIRKYSKPAPVEKKGVSPHDIFE